METKKIHLKEQRKPRSVSQDAPVAAETANPAEGTALETDGKKKEKSWGKTATTAATAATVAAALGTVIGATVLDTPTPPDPPTPEPEPEPEPNPEPEPINEEDIVEPQPTDHSDEGQPTDHSNEGSSDNTDDGSNGERPEETHEPTPEEVAEDVVSQNMVDPNDIDVPTVISVDELTTAYDQYGNELQAALIHTPDGDEWLLADYDGDGIYESLFDLEGNYVAETGGQLTHSDLETMSEMDDGGYLALNEFDDTAPGDDPTVDIINTETGEHVDFSKSEEGYDVDDLIAQLLADDRHVEENDPMPASPDEPKYVTDPEPEPEPNPEPEPEPEPYEDDPDDGSYDAPDADFGI